MPRIPYRDAVRGGAPALADPCGGVGGAAGRWQPRAPARRYGGGCIGTAEGRMGHPCCHALRRRGWLGGPALRGPRAGHGGRRSARPHGVRPLPAYRAGTSCSRGVFGRNARRAGRYGAGTRARRQPRPRLPRTGLGAAGSGPAPPARPAWPAACRQPPLAQAVCRERPGSPRADAASPSPGARRPPRRRRPDPLARAPPALAARPQGCRVRQRPRRGGLTPGLRGRDPGQPARECGTLQGAGPAGGPRGRGRRRGQELLRR